MLPLKRVLPMLACLIGLSVAPPSQAQWAVVDVGAITQLIQEVSYWKQQIQAMSSQLNQLQSTYNAMTGDRERCLAAGMNGYISKPVQPAHLVTTLEHHLTAALAERTN